MTDSKDECNFEIDMNIYEDASPWMEKDRLWQKNVPDSIPKALKYPENLPNLYCYLARGASEFPNICAIFDYDQNVKYTYREFKYNVDKLATALYKLGIKKGDGVAIFTGNCPEVYFAIYAVVKIGAILIPINPLLKKHEVTHIVGDAGIVKAIIVHQRLLGELRRVLKVTPIEKIIVIKREKEAPDTLDFNELMNSAEPKPPKVDINIKEDLAFIIYTGGTTGMPKGVMLTHFNMMANTVQTASRLYDIKKTLAIRGHWTNLAILPLAHIYGLLMAMTTSLHGYMNIIASFEPLKILQIIDKYKVEVFSAIPTMCVFIANHPDFSKYDISSLQLVTSAASALAPATARAWEQAGVKVVQGYGCTELSPASHLQPIEWCKTIETSIGIPIPDTDAKIADPVDPSKELELGQEGELLIRGPQVMKGYWRKPDATAAVFYNGWLRTGDIAKMDENGYFYIVGRTKEQIKYKGYRILPAEVENMLFEHPAVLECAVIGLPQADVGETIKAFIKLRPEYKGKVTEQDIINWAKEEMAGYKWPRIVEFIETIPKTTVGKVFRRQLLERELKKAEGKEGEEE
ncbi:MAG: AMP-binding protein [Candidatus Helarchaeota archaeon]|nr:AMP-binding protein [Candidatus Helarchaeota archaeon]